MEADAGLEGGFFSWNKCAKCKPYWPYCRPGFNYAVIAVCKWNSIPFTAAPCHSLKRFQIQITTMRCKGNQFLVYVNPNRFIWPVEYLKQKIRIECVLLPCVNSSGYSDMSQRWTNKHVFCIHSYICTSITTMIWFDSNTITEGERKQTRELDCDWTCTSRCIASRHRVQSTNVLLICKYYSYGDIIDA